MKKRQMLAVLLAVTTLAASLSGCGQKPAEDNGKNEETENSDEVQAAELEQEFEFYSDDEDLIYYNIPETVEQDGKTYQVTTDISYETTGTRNVVQKVLDVNVEDLEDIDSTYELEGKNGKKYTLNNEQVYVAEQGLVKIPVYDTEVYEDQVGKPSVASQKTITYYNKETGEDEETTGYLKDYYESTPGHWDSILCVDGLFNAPSESSDVYQLAGTSDVTVSRAAETPEWDGYQNDVMKSLGLSSKYYRINSAVWNGGQYEQDGRVYRACQFLGDAFVSTYTAEYEGEREAQGYVTKVFYRTDADDVDADEDDVTTIFKIKAIVKYSLVEE